MEVQETNISAQKNDVLEESIDPINDIIDYLVRCAKISFKNAYLNELEVRTKDKIRIAHTLYKRSATDFLMQFGKYLAPHHLEYFENLQSSLGNQCENFNKCIEYLKQYHSDFSRHKRIRNRRYKALKKLQDETDYFSEKQMMYRNPLLYEQLVGQYLDDDEILERDGADSEHLTLLNLILDTVDRNEMTETKNKQILEETIEMCTIQGEHNTTVGDNKSINAKHWGCFEVPDTKSNFIPEKRVKKMINAPERRLLREEFIQEMYSSFMEGRDSNIDYDSIDNDEQYDDLQQVSQDAEDKYFDSEPNDVENLEEHMELVKQYGRKLSDERADDDPLDVYMERLNKQIVN